MDHFADRWQYWLSLSTNLKAATQSCFLAWFVFLQKNRVECVSGFEICFLFFLKDCNLLVTISNQVLCKHADKRMSIVCLWCLVSVSKRQNFSTSNENCYLWGRKQQMSFPLCSLYVYRAESPLTRSPGWLVFHAFYEFLKVPHYFTLGGSAWTD